MDYSDLLDALINVVYLLRDDEKRAQMKDVHEQLKKRGLLTLIANDNIPFRKLIESPGFSKYLLIEDAVKENEEQAENEDSRSSEIYPENYKIYLTDEGEAMAEDLVKAKYSEPQSLFNWGFMPDFDSKLEVLEGMAMPEVWSEPGQPLVILRAYITNTFKRLLHMKKAGNDAAIIETSKWAAFNTGLIDRIYDPIFALFSLNRKTGMQKWVFNAWCTPGNHRSGQILSRFFDRLPVKATYFDRPSDIFYDINAGMPTLPFGHILERLERLPLQFLQRMAPVGFEWPEGDIEHKSVFFDSLRKAFIEDDYASLRLKDALELSLRRAVKKVAWNYRLVIPVYDPKRRKMMLLIPMSLDLENKDKTDTVLMVERSSLSGKYIGHTIITPAMAYRKARMVMSPIGDWLSPTLLTESAEATAATYDEDTELQNEIATSDADADAALIAQKAQRDAEEKTYVEAGEESKADTETNSVEIFRTEGELAMKTKILGKIDVSAYDKSFLFRPNEARDNTPAAESEDTATSKSEYRSTSVVDTTDENSKSISQILSERDYDIPGIYKHNYGNPYILVGIYRYQAREFTDEDIYDDDDVLFDIRTEPNRKNTGTFRYAVNIRHAD